MDKEFTLVAIEKAETHFYTTKVAFWKYSGLRKIAQRRGVSMAAVIRAAIDREITREGITRPEPPHVRIEINGEPANMGILHRIVHTLRGQD